jgi:hypothetical protein
MVLCLNFALGIGSIPDTPLTIPDAYQKCYLDSELTELFTYNSSTNEYEPKVGAFSEDVYLLTQNLNSTGYDPILENIEGVYQAGVTLKNFLLGGYVINVIDNISFSCLNSNGEPNYTDTNENGQIDPISADNPTGDLITPVDSAVWQYFKAGLQIIFGLLLAFLIFYIVTGKSLGYNL